MRCSQTLSVAYATNEFIRTKESETNYKGLTMAIGSFAEELNTLNKTRY